MESKPVKIIAVETNQGFYVSELCNGYYSGFANLSNKLFDGQNLQPTFHKDWGFIDHKPTKMSHFKKQPNINYRYVLKDDSLKSDRLPLEISKDKVGHYEKNCEDVDHFVWNEDMAMYRSLYEEVSDPQPDKEVIDEFEFNAVFKVDEIKPPAQINYPINERWISFSDKKVTDYATNNNVEHQILDKIIFPTILIHETPCKYSSKETYQIIREHVKRNINNKVARITWDFDTSFKVVKIIGITEPYSKKFDVSRFGSRKPKYETRLINTREVLAFEMYTGNKDNPDIKGFEAKTESELKEQIDNYLNELIDFINEPLIDCPNCKGTGVLFNSKVEPPTRKF